MRVFMTGGAGFLGRAIMRRAAYAHPGQFDFTIFSRDEGKHVRARREFPAARYLLGDIRDMESVETAMAGHDLVIHAGAMKYVPEGERNVWEAIAVNVRGSKNICTAALRTGVARVIGISTDKACQPVNVYGMTKLLMERLFQEADGVTGQCRFNLVRYGNVVSSTGSVIPLFRHQAQAGTITLTDPSMTRFWLRIEDAVDLVWTAMVEEEGGTVLIPRLRSLSMAGVATACATVELGAGQASQVARTIIGQRFGEKVHEELLSPVETIYTREINPRGGVGLMRMYPVTEGLRMGHLENPYRSDECDEPLTTEEMIEWIREAPEE